MRVSGPSRDPAHEQMGDAMEVFICLDASQPDGRCFRLSFGFKLKWWPF
jgi:hypothetical protein